MGSPPDYDPTVPNTNTTAEIGSELEAFVGRENVLTVSGAPTMSDGSPTSGRIAKDTSTSPATYYVGDGTSWVQAGLGSPANPQTADLGGSNGAVTASAGRRDITVLRVDSTSSTANLEGFTASNAQIGDLLLVCGPSGGTTNNVTITDNAGGTNDFQNSGGTSNTIDAASDVFLYVFNGTDWAELAAATTN